MHKNTEYILKKFGREFNPDKPKHEIPNFGRDNLADLFAELDFQSGAEIGVMKGEYSEVLCKANLNLTLHLVDPWLKYDGYQDFGKTMDANLAAAKKRLKPYNCVYHRAFSEIAAQECEDNSLDFVYIDGNHDFPHVVQDIVEWTKKVRVGGIISGHDYILRGKNTPGARRPGKLNTTHHVVEAVDGYTRAYHTNPFFILGRKETVEGEIRDKYRSWMWCKEHNIGKNGFLEI